jgi:hypothetical protein
MKDNYMKTKQTLKRTLAIHSPDRWASIIKRKIRKPGMQYWMASIILWNHPSQGKSDTQLGELSSWYRHDLNEMTAKDLEAAHKSLGLPYRKGASDNAIPSAVRKKLDHDRITPKQRKGNENAKKCCNWYEREGAR